MLSSLGEVSHVLCYLARPWTAGFIDATDRRRETAILVAESYALIMHVIVNIFIITVHAFTIVYLRRLTKITPYASVETNDSYSSARQSIWQQLLKISCHQNDVKAASSEAAVGTETRFDSLEPPGELATPVAPTWSAACALEVNNYWYRSV